MVLTTRSKLLILISVTSHLEAAEFTDIKSELKEGEVFSVTTTSKDLKNCGEKKTNFTIPNNHYSH